MINLDYQSRVPIYMQIVNGIERYVALEILKPEQQIPSIREMALELGVNPNTIKKAYSVLEQRGVIVTLSTKGTYITLKTEKVLEKSIEEKIENIKKQIKELEKLGIGRPSTYAATIATLYEREYIVSLEKNEITMTDVVKNIGFEETPLEILYHCNMGYPLLDEDSIVKVPAAEVVARDDHAANDIENWMNMQKPTAGYQERCYYHKFADENGKASIYQPKLNVGLEISFNATELDGFVEWKMMGVRDYVLGLECGNCYPDGRKVMRESGMLKLLEPGEKKEYRVKVRIK